MAVDERGVDFVLRAVAIDRRPRSYGDDGSSPLADRSPDEPVDQRIFESDERSPPMRRELEQPLGVVAAGMGDRKHDRQPTARRVKDWGRERSHGQLSQIRTDTEMLQRIAPSFASGKSQFFSAL
jgi:hypothetical protein